MRLTSLSLIAGVLLLAPPAFAQSSPEPAMVKAGCTACHTKDRKLVGPSYKEIATKYKGQAGAAASLADKVRQGGKGNFGVIPMPPNPPEKINDADLKAAVEWILRGG